MLPYWAEQMTRQTRVQRVSKFRAGPWVLPLLAVLIVAEAAIGQAVPGTPSSTAASQQTGAAQSPANATAPQTSQPEQTKTPVESAPKNPRNPSQVAAKTLELTDFQQFAAQSLGYVLPIYGASLFDNGPTTFAPVDRIPGHRELRDRAGRRIADSGLGTNRSRHSRPRRSQRHDFHSQSGQSERLRAQVRASSEVS